MTILLTLVIVLLNFAFQIVPGLTRPDLFFSVTIDPAFRRTPTARGIVNLYRAILCAFGVAAIGFQWATGLTGPAALIQCAGGVLALAVGHRQALAHAAAPSPVREVDLAAPRETLPGGPIVALLPSAFVAGLAIWAARNWDRLPQRIPVHWGFGAPDRWVSNTPSAVYGFLGLHFTICLTMAASAWGLLHWSRRISTVGPRAAGERRFRRHIAQMLVVTGYYLAAQPYISLFHPTALTIRIWTSALLTTTAVYIVILALSGQGGSRADRGAEGGSPEGDHTPDACWKWGMFYINPADPSILVEKRFGIGYTLNLGNGRSWALLAVVLAPIALVKLLLK